MHGASSVARLCAFRGAAADKGQTEVGPLHPSGSVLKILGRVSSCVSPHLELFVRTSINVVFSEGFRGDLMFEYCKILSCKTPFQNSIS